MCLCSGISLSVVLWDCKWGGVQNLCNCVHLYNCVQLCSTVQLRNCTIVHLCNCGIVELCATVQCTVCTLIESTRLDSELPGVCGVDNFFGSSFGFGKMTSALGFISRLEWYNSCTLSALGPRVISYMCKKGFSYKKLPLWQFLWHGNHCFQIYIHFSSFHQLP